MSKSFRDGAVFVLVLAILVFAGLGYSKFKDVSTIPMESRYKNSDVSQDLQVKIKDIENSIRDRKQFVFTVQKDPLEQNLIVKTVIDLEKQWRKEIESQVRLTATLFDELGNSYATFAYGGENHVLTIGENIKGGEIVEIQKEFAKLKYGGKVRTMNVTKLPPKPVEIQKNTPHNEDANW